MSQFAYYRVPSQQHAGRIEISATINLGRPREQDAVLAQCAEDYYHQHRGCQCIWPLEIHLLDGPDGPVIARRSVGVEFEPQFTSYPLS